MKEFIKVEGHDGLVRDSQSSAIINVDKRGFQNYRKTKQAMLDKQNQINELENKVNTLESKLDLILEKLS